MSCFLFGLSEVVVDGVFSVMLSERRHVGIEVIDCAVHRVRGVGFGIDGEGMGAREAAAGGGGGRGPGTGGGVLMVVRMVNVGKGGGREGDVE